MVIASQHPSESGTASVEPGREGLHADRADVDEPRRPELRRPQRRHRDAWMNGRCSWTDADPTSRVASAEGRGDGGRRDHVDRREER